MPNIKRVITKKGKQHHQYLDRKDQGHQGGSVLLRVGLQTKLHNLNSAFSKCNASQANKTHTNKY